MSITPLSSITLHFDYDLVAARRRARQVASLLQLDEQDQTRVATVVSELARNVLRSGGGGKVEFGVEREHGQQSLVITVTDRGALSEAREELAGAQRLMDELEFRGVSGGSLVVARKRLNADVDLSGNAVRRISEHLAEQKPESPLEEIQQQNAELLDALGQLNERQQELERLNQELEDTNRGVLALYAELDEKAESLRRADNVKSRFLSDMSHEFRTPVNAILALTRLLEESVTADDSRKQVSLIRRAGEDLETLVSDLLDLAKIEAGKIEIRPAEFEISTLFSALRGMLRPLLLNRSLALVFEETEGLPVMVTDEGKVSQILRNFISNALKFTEAGEIRVTAQALNDRDAVRFCVADTGVGIAAEDQERIFEEFTQIDHPLQRTQKGTGLGLPLTRKLASLLGGTVGVRSTPGVGSTFWAEIPVRFQRGEKPVPPAVQRPLGRAAARRILIIDDDETARYAIGSFASQPGTTVLEAENGLVGISRAQSELPDLILLDMVMPGIGGHEVLQRLKSDAATASIPVIVVTSRFVNDEERKQILSKALGVVYKGDLSRDTILRAIDDALSA